jgi:hypothetical protein
MDKENNFYVENLTQILMKNKNDIFEQIKKA